MRAVAGTSAGGLVGALLSSGCSSHQIEKLLDGLSNPHLFSRSHNDGPALVGLQGLNQLLLDEIDDLLFEELKIPFACTSVDLHTSQEVILAQGSVMDAVMATIAVPGIFPPRQIGQIYADGWRGVGPGARSRWPAGWRHPCPSSRFACNPYRKNGPTFPSRVSSRPRLPSLGPLLDQFAKMRLGQAFQIFVSSMDITSRTC